jgi:hypothetical protein
MMEVMSSVLRSRGDAFGSHSLVCIAYDWRQALMEATMCGHVDAAKFLLSKGADIDMIENVKAVFFNRACKASRLI